MSSRLGITIALLALLAAPLYACVGPAAASGHTGGGGLAVSPPDVQFGDVIRDEPLQRTIHVQNGHDHEGTVTFERSGEMGAWVHVDPPSFVLPANSARSVTFTLQVPPDVPNGGYGGELAVMLSGTRTASGSGVDVRLGVAVVLNATVGGEEVVEAEAGNLRVDEVEERSPIFGSIWMRNSGNVRVQPRIELQIHAADGSTVHGTTLDARELPAGAVETRSFNLTPELAPGQYALTARVSVRDETIANETVAFDVHPWGELRRKGEIEPIYTTLIGNRSQQNRIAEGSSIVLIAPFVNTGGVAVEAQFRGHLVRGGELIGEINSDTLRIDPGERVEFEMPLRDASAIGAYVLSGRVHYSGKVSESSEWILNVQPASPVDLERTGGEANESTRPGAQTPGIGAVGLMLAGAAAAVLLRRRHA